MINEAFMALGDWDLRLKPDTPLSIRREVSRGDSIVITSTRAASVSSRSDLLGVARWRGVLLELSEDRTALAGQGMLWYLGSGPGLGQYLTVSVLPRTWTTYLSAIDSYSDGHGAGFGWGGLVKQPDYPIPGGLWPNSGASDDDLPDTVLEILLYLAGVLDVEFYVTPDGKFYSGVAGSSYLFTITPTVIVMRGQSGRDAGLTGLEIADWRVSTDIYDSAFYIRVVSSAGVGSADYTSEFHGDASGANTLIRTRYYTNTDVDNLTDAGLLVDSLKAKHGPRRTVAVSVNAYDVGRWLSPGDYLYAYDPIDQLYDDTNKVQYHGMQVCPAKLRLYGMRWPIQQGMGVYRLASFTSDTPQVTDLTDYVEFESGPATLEVDAPPRAALT